MFCKICGDVTKAAPKSTPFLNFSRFYNTHYDELNLQRNCTPKDIKNAFIKLSKKHHPDVNKNKKSHEKFQKINEAYRVLGKPETRRDYDLGLIQSEGNPYVRRHHTNVHYRQGAARNPYHDPHFWANRDRTRDRFYEDHPYYGINGVPRLPNGVILGFCLIFALIGISFQYVAIVYSPAFKREALTKRSLESEKMLRMARHAAHNNGNPAQLEALKIKLLGDVANESNDKDNK